MFQTLYKEQKWEGLVNHDLILVEAFRGKNWLKFLKQDFYVPREIIELQLQY
jgi:hypothetical protein